MSRQCAPIARGRTHQVEEFLQRKREAMLNKVRAEGQLVCNVTASWIEQTRKVELLNVLKVMHLFAYRHIQMTLCIVKRLLALLKLSFGLILYSLAICAAV